VDIDHLLARLKSLRESFTTTQLVSMLAAFVAVVGAIAAFSYWATRPTYRLLFSDLDPEAASHVTAKLSELKVPYELAESGRGIRVPEERVDQLRLDFAGQGLPAGGRLGFEIFDGTNFGWTEFLEQVNYRRALEGELARTISTIDEIGAARVHIAMGQKTLFARDRTPAKASVALRLKGRQPLAASTVAGIRNLVAYAIDDLRPEAVVVMDDRGRPLAAGGDDSEVGSPAQLEAKALLEDQLAKKVATMLDPLVGPEHYRVHVTARLNHDAQDEVSERFGREGVVRSEEHSEEVTGSGQAAFGVAGARANTPAPAAPGTNQPATPPAAAAPAPPSLSVGTGAGNQRVHDRRNLEVDKTTTHTTRPAGGIARLSVAVLVDHSYEVKKETDGKETRSSRPRDAAFLQQVSDLTAKVVGLDTSRGDELTVQNVAFEQAFDEPAAEPPAPVLQRVSPLWIVAGVVSVIAVLAGGVLALRLRRKGGRKAGAVRVEAQALPQQQLPRTIEDIEGEIEARLDAQAASAGGDRRVPVLTKRLQGIVQKDPEAAARLVRAWIVEDRKVKA
jgi:flagellar M-ring protein FliF